MVMSQLDPSIGGLLKNLGYATGQFGKNQRARGKLSGGATLLALGFACWFAQFDAQKPSRPRNGRRDAVA
jgi:hypothetical protein